MEKLDFKFPNEEFEDIPTMDFHGYHQNEERQKDLPETNREVFYKEEKYDNQPPTENLEFTLYTSHPNKENVFSGNKLKTQSLQKVKSSLNFPKPGPKKLIAVGPKKPKISQKSKFKKPFRSQKRINSSKIINNDWNDDVKTTGVFQKMESIGFKEHQIKERNYEKIEKKGKIIENKDIKERKKYKTYQTPKLLEESLSKEDEQKKQFLKQVKFKQNQVKEVEELIDKEERQKNVIHEQFSKNIKAFQAQKSSSRENRMNDIDEIPTRENGETQHRSSGTHNLRALNTALNHDTVSQIESKEKQRLLEDMIQKHKEDLLKQKGGFTQTEYTKKINRKIEQIKHEMEPFIEQLNKRTNISPNYAFTNNFLSNACLKMVCVNSEKITEMLIEDILFESVDILNENEEKENYQQEMEKKHSLIGDFIEAVKELQFDQDEILNTRNNFFYGENKIRELKTEDLNKYEKKHYYRIIEVSEMLADKVLKDKLALDSLLNGKSINDKRMANKVKDASEVLINQVLEEVFEEFEKVQDEFVERLYEQEFFQK